MAKKAEKKFDENGRELTARGTPRKTKEEKKVSICKGQDGYWERNTKAGFEASLKVCRAFPDAETLQAKIDEYFEQCEAGRQLPSEHGMAGFLGIKRRTLYGYWAGETCQDLQDTVVKAYDRLADAYIQLLLNGDKNMTSFVIFALKQLAFGGYQDRIEHKNDTTFKIEFGKGMDTSDFK